MVYLLPSLGSFELKPHGAHVPWPQGATAFHHTLGRGMNPVRGLKVTSGKERQLAETELRRGEREAEEVLRVADRDGAGRQAKQGGGGAHQNLETQCGWL